MEAPLILQFSIALLTGMVAATLVPPVRRVVPRPAEIVLWVLLFVVCVIGVLSITNPRAQELTTSAFWGVDQVLNTFFGLLVAGLGGWLVENRFTIAGCLTIGCGLDIMAIALLWSHRKGQGWQPRVRLYEWMELPGLSAPATQPASVPYALDEINRKWAAAMAVAGAAILTWLLQFSIWVRDVLLPRQVERIARTASAGGGESRVRLESLRDTALQLQFAARSWYAAAGAPAVNGLGLKAYEAVANIGSGRHAAAFELEPGRMVDIHVLLSPQPIGWYGSTRPAPTDHAEEDEDESGQTGRLAS